MNSRTVYPTGNDTTRDAASRDNVSKASEALKSDVSSVIDDAENLLKTTANYSAEGLLAAGSKLKDRLDKAKTTFGDAQARAAARFDDATVATREYVGGNPWKSLAIAGSVGIILGLLMSRRG